MKLRKLMIFGAVLTLTAVSVSSEAATPRYRGDDRPPRAAKQRLETFYSVSAHPDDEHAGWALVEKRPDRYTVFVIMAPGDWTTACMTPDESQAPSGLGTDDATWLEGFAPTDPLGVNGPHPDGDRYHGPYKYQGSDSPVGQPDRGERHPFGFPWVGQGTQACSDARVASWHWFLDGMSKIDPSLPNMKIKVPDSDNDFMGEFCGGPAGCAKVWANRHGARVAFNLPDKGVTSSQVSAGFQHLRANRLAWGIPVLPEAGVLANAYHSGGEAPQCPPYDHPDHRAVQEAFYGIDHDAGPQFGVTCGIHGRFLDAPTFVVPQDPETLVAMNYVDPVTEQATGPFVVNYGWLFETYRFGGCPDCTFWKRFAEN